MRVITNRRLLEFAAAYPLSAPPLQVWRKRMEAAHCASYAQIKQTFSAVDKVGEHYVFDIGGNKWRLVAFIRFEHQICYIKHVLTHAEYDKGLWRTP